MPKPKPINRVLVPLPDFMQFHCLTSIIVGTTDGHILDTSTRFYFRNVLLKPWILARPEGFEPPTPRSVVWCSVQLSYGRAMKLKFSDIGIALRKSENRSAKRQVAERGFGPGAILRRYLSMSNKESKISNGQLVSCRSISPMRPRPRQNSKDQRQFLQTASVSLPK